MRLKNKQTGEIVDFKKGNLVIDGNRSVRYNSLAELNEDWEDYEEPKEYWYIDYCGCICNSEEDPVSPVFMLKEIGNYFETREEAERAVEKLKALKRLKDKGFKIAFVKDGGYVYLRADWGILLGDFSDVELLFGGKE